MTQIGNCKYVALEQVLQILHFKNLLQTFYSLSFKKIEVTARVNYVQ